MLLLIYGIQERFVINIKNTIPYEHHYKPRLVFFLPPFFTVVNIVEWLVLQKIYVLNMEILQFLSLKSAIHNQDCFKSKPDYDGAFMLERNRNKQKYWCKWHIIRRICDSSKQLKFSIKNTVAQKLHINLIWPQFTVCQNGFK